MEARIDVNATVGLINGAITQAGGSLERQTWLSPTNQWSHTYTFHLLVARFAWTPFTITFTPVTSGTVTMGLTGPYDPVTPGSTTIYKEEVLWDALQPTGASMSNPGFETVSGGQIVGWSGGISQVGTAAVPAVEGVRMAKTSQFATMTKTFAGTAGVPVTIQGYARAVVPAGFADMTPILDHNTPAHQTALKLMRGANFGNYLEQPSGTSTLSYTITDFVQARAEGFDHVRLPAGWHLHVGAAPTFTISSSYFAQVDAMVNDALNEGLAVIVDIHNFDAFNQNPAATTNEFYAIWGQIAAHYASYPPGLVFELLNEPFYPATTAVLNPIYAEAIRQIRLSNPTRTIIVSPSQYSGIGDLNNLLLPDGENNVIVDLHCYDPFLFTHQGATWVGPDTKTVGLVFPGPPATALQPASGVAAWAQVWIGEYNSVPAELNPSSALAFRGRFQTIKQWADYYGRPVHLGEFGAYQTADAQSRVNFYQQVRQSLEELGIGWSIWDWKAGFHYWGGNQPNPPGMRDALFPAPVLQCLGPGVFSSIGAAGKTFIVDQAAVLASPVGWAPISTQFVTSPQFLFADPATNQNPSAFYRVRWLKN